MPKSNDEIILNYHDSILYTSDFKLLDKSGWLNDRIIGFVYEYYEYEKYEQIVEVNKILGLLNPSVVQLIKLSQSLDEAICCFLEPLEANKKQILLLPINNNLDPNNYGGSHWSLIAINKATQTFIHYDSIIGSNKQHALKLFKKLKDYFNCNKFQDEFKLPQQQNSSDCGVYVCVLSDLIANFIKSNQNSSEIYDLSQLNFEIITPEYIDNFRNELKNIILSLNK